jgi:metallo-beta-lactamase class B
MMRPIAFLLPLLIAAAPALHQDSNWAEIKAEWNVPTTPFRIAGNVHYVGTAGLSAYLITDPKGHVLIDGGLPESAPLIVANIRALGFRIEDVRILLINHAHFDHSGGLAELKRLSGAQLLASGGDKPDLERGKTVGRDDLEPYPTVKVDRVIRDGEHIRLGAIDLVTHVTAGHTKGCTSWSYRVTEQGKPLDVLFACSLTVAGQDLSGGKAYPGAVGDFRRTFARLRSVRADIFLNFHPGAFDMEAKRKRLEAGNPLAFVDPGELARRVDGAQKQFEKELAEQRATKRRQP